MDTVTSVLKTLMSRLYWPTPDVAFSSCQEVAKLLIEPETAELTAKALITSLSKQKSEYRAAVGLLPVVYAWQMSEANRDSLPSPGTLLSVMSCPSPLATVYLRALGAQDWLLQTCLPQFVAIDKSYPIADKDFAETMVGNGVPRILPDIMKSLSRDCGVDCMRHIYCEWNYLSATLDGGTMDPRPDIVWRHSENHVPITTRSVELYLSAYLRTLSWLVHRTSLNIHQGENWSAVVSPAILGYWRTSPRPRPDWWPWLGAHDDSPIPIKLRDAIEVLAEGDCGPLGTSPILRASGRVASGNCPIDLDIRGYLTASSEPPKESAWKSAFDALERAVNTAGEGLTLPPVIRVNQFANESPQIEPTAFSAASAWIRPMPIGVWHWTSLDRGLCVPSEWFVAGGLGVRCNETEIVFEHDGKRTASWMHWNSSLGTASPYIDPHGSRKLGFIKPSNGAALFGTQFALNTVETQTGMHLSWLCRVRIYTKKNGGTSWETVDSYFPVG